MTKTTALNNLHGGDLHRERMAERSRQQLAKLSDVGEIPEIKNRARRDACRLDLERFLVEYFPMSTGLTPLSEDHRRVISRMQSVVIDGGRQANIVYRGFAKTTLSINTAIWATFYGYQRFVPIFGSESRAAGRIISAIKTTLESNEQLFDDFPEVCLPVRKLERKAQRCASQHCGGTPTRIEWKADTIVLPFVEGSSASLAILSSHGLTAAGRGMFYCRSDGTIERPGLVLIDDPQTDESADSPLQVADRLDIIRKSILRMGGHRSSMAVILNSNIIKPDDVPDQLSDHNRNPSWQSERIPMVRKFADLHESFWLGDYARTRSTYDPELLGDQKRAHAEANALYLANREAADAGCAVSWASCYDEETEHSAIQHAYNILIDDGPDVFASECQNKPQTREALAGIVEIRAKDVVERVNGLPRGVVPLGATHLVAHIDVMHSLLYWSVFACNEAMTGSIIDYGTFPEQNAKFFALRDAKRKLSHAYPESQPQAAVEQGLKDLIAHLFTQTFKREDGAAQGLELVLIDWSDGTMSEVVARVCRTSQWKAMLMPAAGVGIGPGDKPMIAFSLKPHEKPGRHWIEGTNKNALIRSVRVDTNYWKSRAADALTCPQANPGAVTMFGSPDLHNKAYADHRMVADHYASEARDRQTSDKTQATVEVWTMKPGRENHYFDNLVGCLVAASMKGCGISDRRITRERRSLSDIMGQKK